MVNCKVNKGAFLYYVSGIYIINLGKTWEKLQLAARVIVAIENPQDIIVQSARPYGQRAVLKFAQYTALVALLAGTLLVHSPTSCKPHSVSHVFSS